MTQGVIAAGYDAGMSNQYPSYGSQHPDHGNQLPDYGNQQYGDWAQSAQQHGSSGAPQQGWQQGPFTGHGQQGQYWQQGQFNQQAQFNQGQFAQMPAPRRDRGITPMVIVGGIVAALAALVFAAGSVLPLWMDDDYYGANYWNLFTASRSGSTQAIAIAGAVVILIAGLCLTVVSIIAIPVRAMRGIAVGGGVLALVLGIALVVVGFMLSRPGVLPAWGMWTTLIAAVIALAGSILMLVSAPKRTP